MTYDEYWAQDPNNCGGCETCFRMFGAPPPKPEGWGQPKPLRFTRRRMVRARKRYNRMRQAQRYLRPVRFGEMGPSEAAQVAWFYGGHMPAGWVYE